MFKHVFADDLQVILGKLVAREPFAFNRYGDGEVSILRGEPVGNAEFQWDRDGVEFQDALTRAFKYNSPNYLMGNYCKCCADPNTVSWARAMCGRAQKHMTFSNIFVNANYREFMRFYKDFLAKRKVVYVCNWQCVDVPDWEQIRVFDNAWRYMDMYVENLEDRVSRGGGEIFLFSAGPLAKVLIHKAYLKNPANTYVDIGSTLDLLMLGRRSRGYLYGNNLTKVCKW